MTNKTKMSNLESYQELTIQISTLNLKLDAILKLLNKPEITIEAPIVHVNGDVNLEGILKVCKDHADKIFSDEEQFRENFK